MIACFLLKTSCITRRQTCLVSVYGRISPLFPVRLLPEIPSSGLFPLIPCERQRTRDGWDPALPVLLPTFLVGVSDCQQYSLPSGAIWQTTVRPSLSVTDLDSGQPRIVASISIGMAERSMPLSSTIVVFCLSAASIVSVSSWVNGSIKHSLSGGGGSAVATGAISSISPKTCTPYHERNTASLVIIVSSLS